MKQYIKKIGFAHKLYKLLRYSVSAVSPELATRMIFRVSRGKKLDTNAPQTLDEHISTLKIKKYNHDPLVAQCADKYRVREYITQLGLDGILNELLGVYKHEDDIPWSQLPDQFVVKWNNACGANLIVPQKDALDIKKARQQLGKWRRRKQWLDCAEMQYKSIPPRIIIEKYLENDDGSSLDDYKFYCFNGRVPYVMICQGRDAGHPKYYYLNRKGELMRNLSYDAMNAPKDISISLPEGYEEMFKYAEVLSKPFPFVRVDFYSVNGSPVFGEMTFTPSGGVDSERPPEADRHLGQYVHIP